ncbi:MAG: HhoA/HhoB/HtrA family serine endopeptidase [Pseudanabaenaceae cyanobacterium bins.39]|nr:HhoA/HhoB/HtrA family serine endopeptidase [Pseudanabaenaceae cyanobacterium bins.39]
MDIQFHKLQKPLTYGAIFIVGGVATLIGNHVLFRHHNLEAMESSQLASNAIVAKVPSSENSDFVTDVVQKDGGAVVRIDSTRTVVNSIPDIFNDPFFGFDAPNLQQKQVVRGTGSGFIFNANGEILTNAHVVSGVDRVKVTLKDGRTFDGKVLGKDRVTDVAVVKIDAQNLPVIRLGNSDRIQVGERAIAIGNPLGLDNTVTTGVVSALGRSGSQVGIPDQQVRFVQTDAAINPGNSGGPLLNRSGEVIGMNTAIIQGAQGIGFAIPINQAKDIAQKLISNGKVEHPYLGIQMVGITPEIKQRIPEDLKVTSDRGLLIIAVQPNSPAAKAGLRSGDVILKANNIDTNKPESLQQKVQESTVGNSLQLEISRNGQPLKLDVQIGSLPDQVES